MILQETTCRCQSVKGFPKISYIMSTKRYESCENLFATLTRNRTRALNVTRNEIYVSFSIIYHISFLYCEKHFSRKFAHDNLCTLLFIATWLFIVCFFHRPLKNFYFKRSMVSSLKVVCFARHPHIFYSFQYALSAQFAIVCPRWYTAKEVEHRAPGLSV